ncbi:hypothetical protein X548_08615 [Stenotrophomonas maltophilia 5BA-I-2]|nr:hypothetical protein X548_08615 [Stenotrophomonas maltophilia 5BA-I-2]
MIEIDPHDRIDLTGPWAGFGFQGGHMFTPEGLQLEPCDMAWWSLTCTLPTPSEFAENGGWARDYPVPTPSRRMWST